MYQRGIAKFIPPASQIIGLVVEALTQYDQQFLCNVQLSRIAFHTTDHFDSNKYNATIAFTASGAETKFKVLLQQKLSGEKILYARGFASVPGVALNILTLMSSTSHL
jgi:hypothetical protein